MNRWGVIDRHGELIIPFKFRMLGMCSRELLISATTEDGAFFVGRDGNPVFDAIFDECQDFSEGLAAIKRDGKWGYINSDGTQVVECAFDYAASFHCGRAYVKQGAQYGVINSQGLFVIPCDLRRASDYSENIAAVAKPGCYWHYVDIYGSALTRDRYRGADCFSEGLASVVDSEGMPSFIDTHGNTVIDGSGRWGTAHAFTESLAAFSDVAIAAMGYMARDGAVVIKPQFAYAGKFVDGHAAVCVKDRYFYIDRTGCRVSSLCFQDASPHREGLADVRIGGKSGFVDSECNLVIEPQFDVALPFSHGVASVAQSS